MHPIVLLFVISLLHAYEARGSDTGTHVFVQKGKDLLLNVTAPVKLVEDSDFKWHFNGSSIIRLFHDNKIKEFHPYNETVKIFLKNHSLLLKKVQQNNSGLYTATVTGDQIKDVGKYIVTVQDPVSLVTGTVDLLSSSSDSCNLTVTCSTQDSHHINSTFRCEANTCSQEEGGERSKVTTSGSSLRVYLSKNFSVICSHSNQVSSDEHTTMIRNFCFKHPGSDTGTHVFVLKGKDLLLNVTATVKLVERGILTWKFNDSIILRLFEDNETKITGPYDRRVKIFLENHSLLLKNVSQADSGRYTAGVIGDQIKDVGKFIVTVQDPVSPVTGTVDLHSSSSDSCNLTVTCSTQDSHHISSIFRCDNNTCSQEEGGERSKVTTSGSSLRVYLSEGDSVICSHSNQVSENTTMIRDFCVPNPGPVPQNLYIIIIVVVIVVLVIIATAAAFVLHRKKGKHETEEMKNTVYETVQVQSLNPLVDQNPTDDAAVPPPSSIYSLIEVGSIKSTEAGDMTQPESLYAQVEKSDLT